MSNKNVIIEKILIMPLNFCIDYTIEEKQKWIHEKERKKKLFRENKIQLNDIKNYLKNHPEFIKAWLNFSENKRSGRYYFKYENGLYIIGKIGFLFMPSKIYISKVEPELPCTLYICKELNLK